MEINFSDTEVASKFLFDSFYFSQGVPKLQKNIIGYARTVNGQQAISTETVVKMKQILLPLIEKRILFSDSHTQSIGDSQPISVLDIAKQIGDFATVFQATLSAPDDEHSFDIDTLIVELLKRDFELLRSGRPRKHRRRLNTPANIPVRDDPWFSYVCYYLLQEHATGSPLFDRMFVDIRARINELIAAQKEYYLYLLEDIVTEYNSHHSDNRLQLSVRKKKKTLKVTSSP